MPEEFSASTESGTPTDSASSNVDVATSASSTGAGEQVSTTDANAPVSAESQIDIGWSLEDKPEEQASIPDNDDDIQELLKDPAVDQERAPGFVKALQNARLEARESRKQANEFKRQIAQFEQFGGFEGVNQTMGLVSDLIVNPDRGVHGFLSSLHSQAYPAYERLVQSVIAEHPEYALKQLQIAGKLPSTQQSAGYIDSETLATIPEHLRQIAKELPYHVLNDLFQQPEEVRNYNLERELKLSQLDTTQRQQAERQWREQSQAAYQQGQESLQKLGSQYEQAHYSELAKWKPLGPDSEPGNQQVYKMAIEGSVADMLSDPKFAQMYRDLESLITNAPLRRMRNESFAADSDERKGRQLAAQLNTRLGQILRERVKLLDGVFRDARAYRESQRSEIPQRTEISGVSSQAGSNGAPPTLDKNGRTNPAWLDWLNARLPGNGARQG